MKKTISKFKELEKKVAELSCSSSPLNQLTPTPIPIPTWSVSQSTTSPVSHPYPQPVAQSLSFSSQRSQRRQTTPYPCEGSLTRSPTKKKGRFVGGVVVALDKLEQADNLEEYEIINAQKVVIDAFDYVMCCIATETTRCGFGLLGVSTCNNRCQTARERGFAFNLYGPHSVNHSACLECFVHGHRPSRFKPCSSFSAAEGSVDVSSFCPACKAVISKKGSGIAEHEALQHTPPGNSWRYNQMGTVSCRSGYKDTLKQVIACLYIVKAQQGELQSPGIVPFIANMFKVDDNNLVTYVKEIAKYRNMFK